MIDVNLGIKTWILAPLLTSFSGLQVGPSLNFGSHQSNGDIGMPGPCVTEPGALNEMIYVNYVWKRKALRPDKTRPCFSSKMWGHFNQFSETLGFVSNCLPQKPTPQAQTDIFLLSYWFWVNMIDLARLMQIISQTGEDEFHSNVRMSKIQWKQRSGFHYQVLNL